MRKLFLILLMSVLTVSFMVTDAQAKRFGGGGSFGMSRNAGSFSKSHTASRAPAAAPAGAAAAAPASTASKWLGPLAGLAIGGLLASMFMGNGLGSGIMVWLLIAGAAFLAWRVFSNMRRPGPAQVLQPMGFQNQNSQNFMGATASAANSPSTYNIQPQASAQDERLVNFDERTFARQAKAMFLRLQAAYDSKNLADIREFTAPEVFAEVQLQLQERGDAVNQTDVVAIDDELLDLTPEPGFLIASVQFVGQVREEANATPVNIKEIWHLRRNDGEANWVVVGIQQA